MRIGKKVLLLSMLLFTASFVGGCASKALKNTPLSDTAIIKGDDFYGHGLTGDNMNLSKAQRLYDSYFIDIKRRVCHNIIKFPHCIIWICVK